MIGPSAGPLRILHLEDSDLDAELIEAELESLGHPVAIERVMTRDAFARAAVAGRHDLILADYVLPTFDGVSALRSSDAVVKDPGEVNSDDGPVEGVHG